MAEYRTVLPQQLAPDLVCEQSADNSVGEPHIHCDTTIVLIEGCAKPLGHSPVRDAGNPHQVLSAHACQDREDWQRTISSLIKISVLRAGDRTREPRPQPIWYCPGGELRQDQLGTEPAPSTAERGRRVRG
jgi:hypothetical protein